jgi:hypothetical protein
MMRPSRALLCAALLLLAGACVDFVAPVPRERTAQPPMMNLDLVAADPGRGARGDSLRVRGSIFRGRDADSLVLRAVDDSLRVGGRAVFPRSGGIADDAYALYDTALVLPGAAARGVPVQLPALALRGVPRREVLVGFASRPGPDTLVVAEGAPIELLLRPAVSDGTESYRSWSVHMERGGAHAGVNATAALPERITIPAAFVPVDTASVLSVLLFENRAWSYVSAADSSGVHLSATTSLRWFVRIVPR